MHLKTKILIKPASVCLLVLSPLLFIACSEKKEIPEETEEVHPPPAPPSYSGSRTGTYQAAGIKVLADFKDTAAITIPNIDTRHASTSLPAGTDVRNGIIRLWFKPAANVAGRLSRFSIELHSEGSPDFPTANYHQLDPGNAPSQFGGMLTSAAGAGRWQAFSVSTAQFIAAGKGADLSSIKFVRLFLRSTAGADVKIQLKNVEWYPNKLPKAAVVFRFDDSYLSEYAFNELKKRGYKAVLYPSPIAGTVGKPGRLTEEQLKVYNDLGWQIASQAWSTEDYATLSAMTSEDKNNEFVKLRNWHLSLGFKGGEDGSYFSQITHRELGFYPAFEKHFRSMVRFDGGFSHTLPMLYGETYPFGDPMNIRCLNGATAAWGANTAVALTNFINQAITNKGVALIAFHNELAVPGNARDGFDAALAFIDANPGLVRVMTLEELYNEYH